MKDQLLASLIYICRHYNNHLPAQALVYDLPLINGQLTPHLLATAAEKAKLVCEPASLDLGNLDNLLLPVIARLTNGAMPSLPKYLCNKERYWYIAPQPN